MKMAMTEIPNSHAIDIDGLNCWSRGKIYQKEIGFPLIQKIQQAIGDINKNAYEPYVVSIGPYHHGSPNIKATEKIKCDSLSYMLELNQEMRLADYIEAINRLEKHVRSCYAFDIQMDKKTFVKMLLLDGCFLINTLCGLDEMVSPILNYETAKDKTKVRMDKDNSECIIGIETQVDSSNENVTTFAGILSRDMLLLENQIPFFVLTKIYEVLKGRNSASLLLEENIIHAIEELLSCYPKANRIYDQPIEIHHLLHLCHMYFKPTEKETQISSQYWGTSTSSFHHFFRFGDNFLKKCNQNSPNHNLYGSQPLKHWRRATQYNEARIELKKRECCDDDPHSLLDITFCNGTLKIPCFTIFQETCDLFQNLVVFEKTCPQFGNYITSYIVFWSHFVTTPDDVSLLVEKGIIKHHLYSDKEVSDFLKSIGDGIILDFNGEYYLKSICHMMEAHYQIWRPRWREWLYLITSKIPNLSRRVRSDSELPTTQSLR